MDFPVLKSVKVVKVLAAVSCAFADSYDFVILLGLVNVDPIFGLNDSSFNAQSPTGWCK